MAFNTSRKTESGLPEAPGCRHNSGVNEDIADVRQTGPIQQSITDKVKKEFEPTHFDIRNDSWMHRDHRAMQGVDNVSESHFSLLIVSDKFKGKNLPARHRWVYKLIEEEMADGGVHAVQMKTKTEGEWDRSN
ncbi:DEKNAAC103442 [Brettanomyces naardenensis]|uniref:DEKNAAC103442 n=1 Tax=Brettanomyces naardenensis TaxID=13370 RepID=A0A448YN64_BRENA|nr:DEKNAAC103442 [Brettanomyces naardenensis]